MIASIFAREGLALAVLLIPACVRWFQGRRLVRRLDDPAFPELRFAANHRLAWICLVSVGTGLLLGPRLAALDFVIAVLALSAANHASHRIIFGERRGVLASLAHAMRFGIAMFGIWFLLALTPTLVLAADPAGVAAAVLLAALSVLWVHLGGILFPTLLQATPLECAELLPEFDRVLEHARCPAPRVFRANAPGGFWVNAFAVPSFHRPGVLLTEDLLQATTPAESAAIFAHEIAHLEWFTRRRLLQRDLSVLLLSALISSVVLWLGPDSAMTALIVGFWPLLCFLPLVAGQSRQQALEHQSDLRALELTGNAEALVSALTKIHHLLRLPRRWRHDLQGRQSHPSLAARVKAIRDAAGHAPEATTTDPLPDLVLRCAGPDAAAVVLAADRVHWLRGAPVGAGTGPHRLLEAAADRRSIRYEDLSDLRLDVRGDAGRQLVAIDRDGTTLRIELQPADVAAVKERLQRVDVRLPGTGREVTFAMQGVRHRVWLSRVWGVFAALFGLLPPFSLPLLAAGGLVVWRPARATLAAAAAVGLGLSFVGQPGQGFQLAPTLLGVVLLFELVARWRAGIEEPVSSGRVTTAILGVLAACYLAGGAWRLTSPLPWMQFHGWARFGCGMTLTLLALAAATLTVPRRSRRVLALAPALLAGLLLVGGTLWFRDHFGDDPLGARTAPLIVEDVELERMRERIVDGYVSVVRISPSGRRMATRYAQHAQGFEVEEWKEGDATFVEALDLAFLDDERIVRLLDRDDGLFLQTLETRDPAQPLTEIALPRLTMPELVVDRDGLSWQITGTDNYRSLGTRLSGSFDSLDVGKAQWNVDEGEDRYLTAMAVNAAPTAVAVMGRVDLDGPATLATWLGPLGGYTPLWEVTLVGETGRIPLALTTMNVRCLQSALGQTRFLCSTYDPEGVTRLWTIDESARRLEPIGTLPGIFHTAVPAAPGQLVLLGVRDDPLWFDGNDRKICRLKTTESAALDVRVESPTDSLPSWLLRFSPEAFAYGARYQAADVRGSSLALVAYRDGLSAISVHRLPARLEGSAASRQARRVD